MEHYMQKLEIGMLDFFRQSAGNG